VAWQVMNDDDAAAALTRDDILHSVAAANDELETNLSRMTHLALSLFTSLFAV